MWQFNTPMLVTWLDAATDLGYEGPADALAALEPQLQLTETLGRFVKLENMQLVLATDLSPSNPEKIIRWIYRIPIQLVVSIRTLSPGRQVYSMEKATSIWSDAVRSMLASTCTAKTPFASSAKSAGTPPRTRPDRRSGGGGSTKGKKPRKS